MHVCDYVQLRCRAGGDQVYTECLGIDKNDAYAGSESKANTASVNAMAFERHRNKAEFYLARGQHTKGASIATWRVFKLGSKGSS